MDLKIPKKSEQCYSAIVIVLTIVTFLLFCFTLFVNFAAGVPDIGWFVNDIGQTGADVNLEINPSPATFSIWFIIYSWQLAWIVYVLTTLCRRNKYGAVFTNPPIVTPFYLMSYCLNLWLTIMWLFLWDRGMIIWAMVDMFFIYFTLDFPCLMSHHVAVDKYGKQLRKDHRKDLWAIRILIQNGLVVYRTWIVIAMQINFGVVLTNEGGVSNATASTVGLAFAATFVLADFILATTIWDKYLRYTFSNWFVYIWALIGILAGNWDVDRYNSIITLLLLFLVIILLGIRIAVTAWRHRHKPLYV